MDAASLIRQARREAALTQAQLAERAGTSQSEIARLESPGANPRLQTLSKVVAAAGSKLELSLGEASGIDPTLIGASLREPPGERLRRFEGISQFAHKYRGAARRSRA